MSSPGDTPPLRVLFNVPVLRALPTIRGDGVAVDFEGFSFFVYLSGEEETATRFTLTPEVPGALELVVTRCHAGGAHITVMPRVATVPVPRAVPAPEERCALGLGGCACGRLRASQGCRF